MLLTGQTIDAQTALAWGLVNRVVAGDQLDREIKKFTDIILSRSSVAIGLGKRTFYEQIDKTLVGAYDTAGDAMVLGRGSRGQPLLEQRRRHARQCVPMALPLGKLLPLVGEVGPEHRHGIVRLDRVEVQCLDREGVTMRRRRLGRRDPLVELRPTGVAQGVDLGDQAVPTLLTRCVDQPVVLAGVCLLNGDAPAVAAAADAGGDDEAQAGGG